MDLEGIADLLVKGLEGGAGVGYLVMNAVVMLVVHIVNVVLKDSIPVKARIWVAMGLGALIMFGMAKFTGRAWGHSALMALIGGVLSGTAAGGTWSAGGKKLVGLLKKKGGEGASGEGGQP